MDDGKIFPTLADLRHLKWSRTRQSSGTAGSFLKSMETVDNIRWYYKLSNFDAYKGVVGHECINEIIADRLLVLLGIPHLSYQLLRARILIDGQEYITWLCRSMDYRKPGESKIALDAFYQMEREAGESPLDFCLRNGWAEYIYQMLLIDFLILNRDRHGANMEFLRNRPKKTIRLAPLFDHGLSFYFSVHGEVDLRSVNPMEDKRIQCFVGSNSAMENLRIIPEGGLRIGGLLNESSHESIFTGLETALSASRREAIWEMIRQRWHYAREVLSIRHF